jgi:hypothetical protein
VGALIWPLLLLTANASSTGIAPFPHRWREISTPGGIRGREGALRKARLVGFGVFRLEIPHAVEASTTGCLDLGFGETCGVAVDHRIAFQLVPIHKIV